MLLPRALTTLGTAALLPIARTTLGTAALLLVPSPSSLVLRRRAAPRRADTRVAARRHTVAAWEAQGRSLGAYGCSWG